MNAVIKSILSGLLLMTLMSLSRADVLLKQIEGQSIPFSTLKGQWVLINYWARWCQTCLDEIPEFNRFYQSHQHDKVSLFAVNYDALPLFKQKNLIHRFNITYPNLIEDPAKELNLGDIAGVPVTFIFNPKGELVKKLYGGQSLASLNEAIMQQ